MCITFGNLIFTFQFILNFLQIQFSLDFSLFSISRRKIRFFSGWKRCEAILASPLFPLLLLISSPTYVFFSFIELIIKGKSRLKGAALIRNGNGQNSQRFIIRQG